VKEYILVIELTTRAVHSHLVSQSGEVAHTTNYPLETRVPNQDRQYITELDPRRLWLSICSSVADCVKRAKGGKIVAVTTTSQRLTTAVIDKEGGTSAMCPNTDARGAEMDDVITGSLGAAAYETTGLQPPFLFSVDRIRWFKSNEPDIFESMKYVTTIDGWIYFKLTGKPAEEPSQAAGTMLFDIKRRGWWEETVRIAGIDMDKLPKVVNFGGLVGYPTEEFHNLTGITSRTPVIMGAGDTQCSGVGSLVTSPGQAFVSLGSTAPLQMVMPEPRVDKEKRTWTSCYPIDDQWVLESNSGMCGAIFDWLALSVLQVSRAGGVDYARFDDLAKSAPRGSLDVNAFLGPSIMDARAFTQVSPATIVMPSLLIGKRPGAPEIARACYEDIAYACKGNLEQMKEVWPTTEPNFRAGGGLSKSDVLMQILADVLATPVITPVESRTSAVGASIAAWSYLRSKRPKDIISETVRTRTTVSTKDSEPYQSDYRRWRLIYDKVRELM
jgi:autoinducer 2 (AI-2) kinase